MVVRRGASPADFDGDGRTDISVYRPSTGGWFILGQPGAALGGPGDLAVPADYNGDGRTDIAVYRPSTGGWFILGQPGATWGVSTDLPLPLPTAIKRFFP